MVGLMVIMLVGLMNYDQPTFMTFGKKIIFYAAIAVWFIVGAIFSHLHQDNDPDRDPWSEVPYPKYDFLLFMWAGPLVAIFWLGSKLDEF